MEMAPTKGETRRLEVECYEGKVLWEQTSWALRKSKQWRQMLWKALAIRYGPGLSELTSYRFVFLPLFSITLSPFFLLRQCIILLVFKSFLPMFSLSFSNSIPGESCYRTRCNCVGCTVLLLQSLPMPWGPPRGCKSRTMAGIVCAMISAPSQCLTHCRGSTNICGWVSGWINAVNL